MADSFIDVEFSTDEQTLADDAVASLQTSWPSWEPNDGDLEVVLIETLAAMASDVASIAANVPATIFQEYGSSLLGVQYQPGVGASTTVTFTLIDAVGYVIPAGTEIDIDGYAFAVDADKIVSPGSSSAASVPVTCVTEGTEANGLGDVASMISALSFVTAVVADADTAGGTAAETDAEYLDRLNLVLRLRAQSLVTARDYELFALQQDGISRATASTTAARAVTVTVTDVDGEAVSAGIKTALAASYALYKLVNVVPTIVDPTYVTVPLTYVVKAYSGFDKVELKTRIDDVVTAYLDPAVWGLPQTIGDIDSTVWQNDPIIRLNKLIDLIGSVNGVDYVDTISLTGASNLLTNTSFETNTTGWSQNAATGSLTRDTTANGAHSGSASGQQVNPGTNASEGIKVTADVVVAASTSYTLSCWLKGSGSSEAVTLSLAEYATDGTTLIGTTSSAVVLTTDWQRVTVTRAFGSTGVKARPRVAGTNTAAVTFYVDDLSLVSGTGTAVLNADLDLEMPGIAALPRTGVLTGTVL
jgi:hypothetical protein